MSNNSLKPSELEINEIQYNVDFQISKKYQRFSSEILRISLIGIGAMGFFLEKLKGLDKLGITFLTCLTVRDLLIVSLFMLAISCTFSLVHQYCSSESLAYIISHLRFLKAANDEGSDEVRKQYFAGKAEKEKIQRDKFFKWSSFSIAFSALFLSLGAIFLVLAFSISIS